MNDDRRLPRRRWVRHLSLAGLGLTAAWHPATGADIARDSELPGILAPPLESGHERISMFIEGTVQRVDRFFGDDRAFEDATDSYVQLRLDTLYREDEDLSFESSVRAKWDLPGTEKRFRLILESDPEEEDLETPEDNLPEAVEEPNTVLGIEGSVPRTGRWRIKPSLGVKATWPPDPFARLRATRYYPLGAWTSRVFGQLSWFESQGSSVRGTVDFDRPLGTDLLFRTSSSVGWKQDGDVTSASETLTLFQRLNPRSSLAYDIGVSADDDPEWDVRNYFATVRYRRRIHADWLFAELRPRMDWPREEDYRDTWSVIFRLEINFGERYRRSQSREVAALP